MQQLKSFSDFEMDEEMQEHIDGGFGGKFRTGLSKMKLIRRECQEKFDKGRTYYAYEVTQKLRSTI